MSDVAEKRLSRLLDASQGELIRGGAIGLEKESVRVRPDGTLSQTPHPSALGSPLTNPYVTTDYSDALIEFITPAFDDVRKSMAFLRDTQKFVYDRLDNEILWATSMPCIIAGETSIPIAQYGNSNAGTMKTVYRRGLGHRYGRAMQVIAGVHFNYSLPEALWPPHQQLEGDRRPLREFIDDAYFGMIRNMQRLGWLIPYLFGASPAVCKSFLNGMPTTLKQFDPGTYYEPHATSLRMGDIGYQNNKEHELGFKARYDNLDAYVESLTYAIETPCPEYEAIGVVVNGRYEQLNANLLQIENEYYSTIRPKQLLNDNEKPTLALRRRGVRYVELRSVDVNAFEPLGLCESQLRFLEALMVFCLLDESPPLSALEREEIDHNEITAAHRGREPALMLLRRGKRIALRAWAMDVCAAMAGICEALDGDSAEHPYTTTLAQQKEAVRDPDRTPSARMLAEMRETEESFHDFAWRMSQQHRRYFRALTIAETREQFLIAAADDSLLRQRRIEASDDCSFDEYLRRYFAQSLSD